MTPAVPPEVERRAFAVGFAMIAAFLVPLLGREFAELLGLHPRALSYAALAYVLFETARAPQGPWFRPRLHWLHFTLLALLFAMLGLFPWSGPVIVPGEPTTVDEYAGHKLTRMFITTVPTVLVAVSARRFLASPRFAAGVAWGATVIAGIGTWQMIDNRDVMHADNAAEFKESAAFSTISLSLVYLFLQIVWCDRWLRDRRHAWRPVVATCVAVVCVFLLAQRTAILLAISYGLWVVARSVRRRTSAIFIALCLLVVGWLAADLVMGIDTTRLMAEYPAQIRRLGAFFSAEDRSSALRVEMWSFGWNEGLRVPEGHGVGSFAHYFPIERYPHNVFIEALFELGVPGAVLVAVLLVAAARALVRLFRHERGVLLSLGMATTLSYALKAGDLSSAGNWLFWLYLVHAIAECPGSERHWERAR